MGTQDRTLVIMTNGDVYYASAENARVLIDLMGRDSHKLYTFIDNKSGARVAVQLNNISSVVKEADRV